MPTWNLFDPGDPLKPKKEPRRGGVFGFKKAGLARPARSVIFSVGGAVTIGIRINTVDLTVAVDIEIIFIRDPVSVDVFI